MLKSIQDVAAQGRSFISSILKIMVRAYSIMVIISEWHSEDSGSIPDGSIIKMFK